MWSLRNRFLIIFKKNYFPYVFSIIVFLALVISSYYLIFYRLTSLILERQITALISSLGISLALFQFMINDINIKRRNNLSLKLEAYKEIILNFETLLNIVNIGGATKDRFEAHAKLTNIIMTFGKNTSIIIELVNLNFPEIINKKSLKKTISKLSEIEELTNELRVSIEGEGIGGLFGSSALFGEPISPEEKNESIERDCQNKIFEWNEKVEPLIGELCILKKKFYKDLRNSLAL